MKPDKEGTIRISPTQPTAAAAVNALSELHYLLLKISHCTGHFCTRTRRYSERLGLHDANAFQESSSHPIRPSDRYEMPTHSLQFLKRVDTLAKTQPVTLNMGMKMSSWVPYSIQWSFEEENLTLAFEIVRY